MLNSISGLLINQPGGPITATSFRSAENRVLINLQKITTLTTPSILELYFCKNGIDKYLLLFV